MIEIGKYNTLKILRRTSVGLYLGDEEGEDVLLPNKYCPNEYNLEDEIKAFVYLDYAERKVATNLTPKVTLDKFAFLKVTDITEFGAFLDWGLEKELMVPFREQRQKMEINRWYVVYMKLDELTNRLYASNKIEKFLQNESLTVAKGDQVELLVFRKTDLGYAVIINDLHKGLVFKDAVFKELHVGDSLKGYVKTIRDDNKIDISIQPIGYAQFNDVNAQKIFEALIENEGSLNITDKSSPEEIYSKFGISKKSFKRAIGALYKQRKITLKSGSIQIASEK